MNKTSSIRLRFFLFTGKADISMTLFKKNTANAMNPNKARNDLVLTTNGQQLPDPYPLDKDPYPLDTDPCPLDTDP